MWKLYLNSYAQHLHGFFIEPATAGAKLQSIIQAVLHVRRDMITSGSPLWKTWPRSFSQSAKFCLQRGFKLSSPDQKLEALTKGLAIRSHKCAMSSQTPWTHCDEKSIYVFPEKELRTLSPKFHIHVSASDLYIPHIFLKQNWRPIGRIYK
jgi:hypothetical protein